MVTRKRVAAGRSDAKRWELHEDGAYLGDLVQWVSEGTWEFQPFDGLSDDDTVTGASEAEVLLRSGVAARAERSAR